MSSDIVSSVIIPPAPTPHPRDLPPWYALLTAMRCNLQIWPDYAFECLMHQRRMLGSDILLVNDPAALRQVFVENADNYRRSLAVRRIATPFSGQGLFVAEGAEGRRQRRLLASTFTPASISVLIPHFHAAATRLLSSLKASDSAEFAQSFQDTALDAVLRALFSVSDRETNTQLSVKMRAYLDGPGRPSVFDGIAIGEDQFSLATKGRRRFQTTWFAEIDSLISARRQNSVAHQRDMLDILMGLREVNSDRTLSDQEIRDQCSTMIFAGSETTALLMFWAVYLLALDHTEQLAVQAELTAFSCDRVVSLDDMQNWPRLRNVLLETLRLYPPLPHLLRDAVGPDKIGVHDIHPGAHIWVSPWVLHRHRKFWDRPEAFIPSRFATTPAPWVQNPAFIPFGMGARICIGLQFALCEAQIVLAHLLSRYRITLTDTTRVMPIGGNTIRPSPEPTFRLEVV